MSDTKLLAKDLRIGNLHYYNMRDHLDDRQVWEEICAIEAEDIVWLNNNPDDPDYSPIPLSEDVLKNINQVKFYESRLVGKYWTIEFSREWNSSMLIMREYPTGGYSIELGKGFSKVCTTLHEFQNFIHSLTGEELVYTA